MTTPLFYFDLKLGQFSITLIEKNGVRNIILSVYKTTLFLCNNVLIALQRSFKTTV